MTDADLTSYCGLYCGDCIRFRSRASKLAGDLIEEFEKTRFSDYARVKRAQLPDFDNFEKTVAFLAHVLRLRCEVPCRLGGDGCIDSCGIAQCVKSKSFEGCWECARYEACEKLNFLKPFHGNTPVGNLRRIKELGIDAWTEHRGKCYPWLR